MTQFQWGHDFCSILGNNYHFDQIHTTSIIVLFPVFGIDYWFFYFSHYFLCLLSAFFLYFIPKTLSLSRAWRQNLGRVTLNLVTRYKSKKIINHRRNTIFRIKVFVLNFRKCEFNQVSQLTMSTKALWV